MLANLKLGLQELSITPELFDEWEDVNDDAQFDQDIDSGLTEMVIINLIYMDGRFSKTSCPRRKGRPHDSSRGD